MKIYDNPVIYGALAVSLLVLTNFVECGKKFEGKVIDEFVHNNSHVYEIVEGNISHLFGTAPGSDVDPFNVGDYAKGTVDMSSRLGIVDRPTNRRYIDGRLIHRSHMIWKIIDYQQPDSTQSDTMMNYNRES
jgi:hypothetical protein